MFRRPIEWLDRCAISAAARSLDRATPLDADNAGAAELIPQVLAELRPTLPFLHQDGETFQFESLAPVGLARNDTVHGKLFRAEPKVDTRGAVILLHGWNAELQYLYSFPRLGRRLKKLGLSTAMIEMPLHLTRRPREPNVPHDFISHDLGVMLKATRQCLQDLHSLALWLKAQHYRQVFIWGFSLGAWLAGLLCCISNALDAAVLVTPISQLDTAIQQLAFCRPIREALQRTPLDLAPLNLPNHRPQLAPETVLLVQSEYDLFAPGESIDELSQAWNHPRRWTVKHGHLSILLSRKQMDRISGFLKEQTVRR